jgi:hypothetical protein
MSHKVNKQIEVTYQAAGAQSGLTDVTMVIYDETHSLDGVNFPDVTMTEIGSTGRYYGTFTPDAEGEWNVLIDSATVPGKVVKQYTVVAHDVDSVGDAVGGLNNLSSADVAGELATYDAPTKAELDTAESNIRGGSETLETVKNAIDALPQTAPPMVG